ncbi:hypothetical protein CLOP_g15774, partial [Closterium sp. NIES-67]
MMNGYAAEEAGIAAEGGGAGMASSVAAPSVAAPSVAATHKRKLPTWADAKGALDVLKKGADQVVVNNSVKAGDFSFRRDVHATSLFPSIPVLAHDIYARFPGKVVYRRERKGVEAAARELYSAIKN